MLDFQTVRRKEETIEECFRPKFHVLSICSVFLGPNQGRLAARFYILHGYLQVSRTQEVSGSLFSMGLFYIQGHGLDFKTWHWRDREIIR